MPPDRSSGSAPGGTGGAPTSPSNSPPSGSGSPATPSSPGVSSTPSPSPSPSPSSAPSATPAPSPPAPSGPQPTGPVPHPDEAGGTPSTTPSTYDFSSIFGDEMFAEPPSAAPPVVVPPAPAGDPPAPQPQAPVAPQTAAPPAPTQTQTQSTQAPQGAAQAATPVLDPGDPASIARAMHENRDQFLDHLAKNTFALSNEDMAALEADVAGTVPRLLARVHVESTINALTQMGRIVPQMVQRHLQEMRVRHESESGFYARWPAIDRSKPELRQLVDQYAHTLRAMHPAMTTQEMYERIGPMVMMAAGIPLNAQGQPAPATMQPQPNGAGAPRQPQMQPFVPAPAGVPAAALAPDPANDYSFMGGHED
jgi:hypothetical protein